MILGLLKAPSPHRRRTPPPLILSLSKDGTPPGRQTPPRPLHKRAMCNLYRMTRSPAEVAEWFRAVNEAAGANTPELVYPQYPGLVVARGAGEDAGGRAVRQMVWGFPLTQRSARTGQMLKPRPVNNACSDKLDSFMWRQSFAERRCLIPLTAWAEAEGTPKSKGGPGMTRTWLTLPDRPLFAAAGLWRRSEEWGAVFTMVMTDSCGAAADCHDRMPVLLRAEDEAAWVFGGKAEAEALCVPYGGEVAVERTGELWGG